MRRLAYEAADAGLLSPELAASIRRVKGVRKLGVKLGNWLTAEQACQFLHAPSADSLKGKRDRAMLAILLGLWTAATGIVGPGLCASAAAR